MSWQTEWKGLSARIISIADAVRLFTSALGTTASGRNSAGAEQDLVQNADRTFHRIVEFRGTYDLVIPRIPHDCLVDFINRYHGRF